MRCFLADYLIRLARGSAGSYPMMRVHRLTRLAYLCMYLNSVLRRLTASSKYKVKTGKNI